MGSWGKAIFAVPGSSTDYEILTITTTDANYKPITFSQPVKIFRVQERAGSTNVLFRKAAGSGNYMTIFAGSSIFFPVVPASATVGHVARPGATDITVEVIGFF